MQETIQWQNEVSIRGNPLHLDLPYLFPEQLETVKRIEERFEVGKGRLITDGTGTGKAQPLYSKIATPNGFVPMGTLSVGDKVIGYDGKPKTVLGIYPQGIKEVYKVTFQDGSSTQCCEEHLWETQTLRERRNELKRSYNKVNINNTPNKWKPKVRSLKEIQNSIGQRHFVPMVKAVKYKAKSFDIDPYTLGVLLGDGCLKSSSYTITSDDYEIIENCKLPLTDKFVLRENKKRTNGYKIKGSGLRNKKGYPIPSLTQQYCRKLKLDNCGSLEKFVPKKYMYGSIKQRLALLQGLMDTDGTVEKGRASFCSISKLLINAICELVRSLGGSCSINFKDMGKYHNAYIVHMNLPIEFNPFKLKRKAEAYNPSTKYFPKKIIVSIDLIGKTQTQCISIDCPRHLYVTDDYILTHNTYIGLGIAKRFTLLGKNKILILTPTDDKCKDWISDALDLNLHIMQLEGIRDKGYGVRTTTYANYRDNEAIILEEFDLIIYDESHYIMQNAKGKETSCYDKHKLMCSLPSVLEIRGRYIIGEPPFVSNGPNDLNQEQEQELSQWRTKCYDAGLRLYHKTKVLMLSATPFTYHKTIKYCDGLLWDIEEKLGYDLNEDRYYNYNYNQAYGFDKFLCDNFGYLMKQNKLTKPDHHVDIGLLEREFFEKAAAQNLMSTRVLELDVDYSRHFIKVDTDVGLKIDEFFEMFYKIDDKRMSTLKFIFNKHFNHLYMSKIIESAKAEKILDRLDVHLMLGRKIIIFHGFNNIDIEHPFLITDCEKYLEVDQKYRTGSLNRLLAEFYQAYPEWAKYDLKDLKSVPEIMKKHFGNRCVLYNGTISKKKRKLDKERFMVDNGDVDVIVIQSQAGQAGISLHDTTDVHQRVMVDLSLPTRPPEAIQKEGRSYRHGSVSNAIYEYPTLQTTTERTVFAHTVAERAKTVENLAMGNLARDLESAFKLGYENFEEDLPSIAQGRLGKLEDKKMVTRASPYDKAITYYHLREKANSKRKHYYQDFFATPEPLAFKMVEWAYSKYASVWMDPSCGDGAIARFFPENTKRLAIDVDANLLSLCKLKANVESRHIDFMEYKINNKADRIIMNPPFGYGGKTAVEHLLKALIHLQKDGWAKLYCILPSGGNADKHFERMTESDNMKFFEYSGELLLPSCTFTKAGTKVMTRVVRFEGTKYNPYFQSINLTHCNNVNELFSSLKDLNF